MERDFLPRPVVTSQQVLNSKNVGIDGHREEILYCEVGEALAQVAQRCGCPTPGLVLRLGQDRALRNPGPSG